MHSARSSKNSKPILTAYCDTSGDEHESPLQRIWNDGKMWGANGRLRLGSLDVSSLDVDKLDTSSLEEYVNDLWDGQGGFVSWGERIMEIASRIQKMLIGADPTRAWSIPEIVLNFPVLIDDLRKHLERANQGPGGQERKKRSRRGPAKRRKADKAKRVCTESSPLPDNADGSLEDLGNKFGNSLKLDTEDEDGATADGDGA